MSNSGTGDRHDIDTPLSTDIRISGLGLRIDRTAQGKGLELGLEHLETDTIEGQIGAFAYQASALVLDSVRGTVDRGQVRAEAADITGFTARVGDAFSLSAEQISCPRGLMYTSGQELHIPHATLSGVRLTIDDFSAMGSGEPKDDREPLDWHFLDIFDGRLDLDLVVDMTLPWIGRRRATHYFRIPIQGGTIDYEELEDDVHWLESAFLTIERVGDLLILERDLPLVPYSGKALLEFPLEPEDVALAAYSRVHVRNLIRGRVPEKKSRRGDSKKSKDEGQRAKSQDESHRAKSKSEGQKAKSKKKLKLHSLSLEKIKLNLDSRSQARIVLPGDGLLLIGDDDSPGIADLAVTGELRYEADESNPPTTLSGQIGRIDLTVKDIPLGGNAHLSADRLHLGHISPFQLGFNGFIPHRLELGIDRITATNLRITL